MILFFIVKLSVLRWKQNSLSLSLSTENVYKNNDYTKVMSVVRFAIYIVSRGAVI